MKLFTPDYYVESYRALDLERLKRHGIRVLVCDIDNTLAAHDAVSYTHLTLPTIRLV